MPEQKLSLDGETIMDDKAHTVGTKVTWTSKSGGYEKSRFGVILAVVPANIHPSVVLPPGYSAKGGGFGGCRKTTSYLMAVDGSNAVFWPRKFAVVRSTNEPVRFKSLALGARFRLDPNAGIVWVKIQPDTIAKWIPQMVAAEWVGQPICDAFENDIEDYDVWLAEGEEVADSIDLVSFAVSSSGEEVVLVLAGLPYRMPAAVACGLGESLLSATQTT